MGRCNRKAVLLTIVTFSTAGCAGSGKRLTYPRSPAWRSMPGADAHGLRPSIPPKILPETHLRAARLFESQRAFHKALIQYRKAIALNHSYVEAYHRLGLLLSIMGRRDEAIAALRRAVELKPDDALLRNNLGFELVLGKRYDEALEELTRAVELAPNFARARVNLGIAQGQLGRFAEALASFRSAMPEADAQYNLGLMYRGHGQYEQAAAAFRLALSADSRFTAAEAQLARLTPHLQPERALEPDTRVAAQAPEDNRRRDTAETAPPPPDESTAPEESAAVEAGRSMTVDATTTAHDATTRGTEESSVAVAESPTTTMIDEPPVGVDDQAPSSTQAPPATQAPSATQARSDTPAPRDVPAWKAFLDFFGGEPSSSDVTAVVGSPDDETQRTPTPVSDFSEGIGGGPAPLPMEMAATLTDELPATQTDESRGKTEQAKQTEQTPETDESPVEIQQAVASIYEPMALPEKPTASIEEPVKAEVGDASDDDRLDVRTLLAQIDGVWDECVDDSSLNDRRDRATAVISETAAEPSSPSLAAPSSGIVEIGPSQPAIVLPLESLESIPEGSAESVQAVDDAGIESVVEPECFVEAVRSEIPITRASALLPEDNGAGCDETDRVKPENVATSPPISKHPASIVIENASGRMPPPFLRQADFDLNELITFLDDEYNCRETSTPGGADAIGTEEATEPIQPRRPSMSSTLIDEVDAVEGPAETMGPPQPATETTSHAPEVIPSGATGRKPVGQTGKERPRRSAIEPQAGGAKPVVDTCAADVAWCAAEPLPPVDWLPLEAIPVTPTTAAPTDTITATVDPWAVLRVLEADLAVARNEVACLDRLNDRPIEAVVDTCAADVAWCAAEPLPPVDWLPLEAIRVAPAKSAPTTTVTASVDPWAVLRVLEADLAVARNEIDCLEHLNDRAVKLTGERATGTVVDTCDADIAWCAAEALPPVDWAPFETTLVAPAKPAPTTTIAYTVDPWAVLRVLESDLAVARNEVACLDRLNDRPIEAVVDTCAADVAWCRAAPLPPVDWLPLEAIHVAPTTAASTDTITATADPWEVLRVLESELAVARNEIDCLDNLSESPVEVEIEQAPVPVVDTCAADVAWCAGEPLPPVDWLPLEAIPVTPTTASSTDTITATVDPWAVLRVLESELAVARNDVSCIPAGHELVGPPARSVRTPSQATARKRAIRLVSEDEKKSSNKASRRGEGKVKDGQRRAGSRPDDVRGSRSKNERGDQTVHHP